MDGSQGLKINALSVAALLVAVSACAPMPANVTQFNGNSVTIQRLDMGPPNENDPAIVAPAQNTCATDLTFTLDRRAQPAITRRAFCCQRLMRDGVILA